VDCDVYTGRQGWLLAVAMGLEPVKQIKSTFKNQPLTSPIPSSLHPFLMPWCSPSRTQPGRHPDCLLDRQPLFHG
jgi:hypothetical protein